MTDERQQADAESLRAFGRDVKAARAARSWSMEDAATHSGLTRKTWQRIESGCAARMQSIECLERAFEVPKGTAMRAYVYGESLALALSNAAPALDPVRDVKPSHDEPERLSERRVFSDVLAEQFTLMAGDYQRIADKLRDLAGQVPAIGERSGLSTVTATGLATDALREIARDTPSPATLVKAAADYEKHVPSV